MVMGLNPLDSPLLASFQGSSSIFGNKLLLGMSF
uniref:Uncharacterized protein n=1 Tax=Rhizophora mucronata TaxID=61149 RepID=A0A2P2N2U0_RHIMU